MNSQIKNSLFEASRRLKEKETDAQGNPEEEEEE